MPDENIQFNEKLKFSWGHIIAAVALVAIAYCTFIGATYLLKGLFLWAGIATAVIVLLLAALFFIPQQLKATDHRFEKRIKWERAFIFSSPFLFILLMIPFAHSWTVHHRQDTIKSKFSEIFNRTFDMFGQYESYAHIRDLNYRHALDIRPDDSTLSVSEANKLEVLHLALLSSNYDMLKQEATNWMLRYVNTGVSAEETSKVSTWNVFVLGNVTGIQEAIHQWHSDLQSFSETKLSDEEGVKIFDESGRYLQAIDQGIDNIKTLYTDIKGFNPITLLWLLLAYAMLLFPYLLQERHTKTIGTRWTLFGFRDRRGETLADSLSTHQKPTGSKAEKPSESAGQMHSNDPYQSFKL